MKIAHIASLSIAACLVVGAPSVSLAQTGDGRMAKCKTEIGWSAMTKTQKTSPETIRRLEECKKKMK